MSWIVSPLKFMLGTFISLFQFIASQQISGQKILLPNKSFDIILSKIWVLKPSGLQNKPTVLVIGKFMQLLKHYVSSGASRFKKVLPIKRSKKWYVKLALVYQFKVHTVLSPIKERLPLAIIAQLIWFRIRSI